MIDFTPVRQKEQTLQQVAEGLTRHDLVRLTNEMCDHFLELIADAEDPDTTFVPDDPEANDTFAATEDEVSLPWTLGHVIVHWTASSEESAALALTLARGIVVKERSRYEVPWQEADTAAFLRARIEESRRMQLSMLAAWPDRPHLEVTYSMIEGRPPMNALTRFVSGLYHADSHREQVRKTLAQAGDARANASSATAPA